MRRTTDTYRRDISACGRMTNFGSTGRPASLRSRFPLPLGPPRCRRPSTPRGRFPVGGLPFAHSFSRAGPPGHLPIGPAGGGALDRTAATLGNRSSSEADGGHGQRPAPAHVRLPAAGRWGRGGEGTTDGPAPAGSARDGLPDPPLPLTDRGSDLGCGRTVDRDRPARRSIASRGRVASYPGAPGVPSGRDPVRQRSPDRGPGLRAGSCPRLAFPGGSGSSSLPVPLPIPSPPSAGPMVPESDSAVVSARALTRR